MTVCFNCNGWKRIQTRGLDVCPDCMGPIERCECGSRKDSINLGSIKTCPTCKGSGESPPFQTGFLYR